MPKSKSPSVPRPARLARTSRSRGLVLGIHIGVTKAFSGLVAADGMIVRRSGRFLYRNAGPGNVIRTAVRSARACLEGAEERPARIGIAVAGQVDPRTGTVVHAPNLGWRDVPLARRVEEELGIPVSVVNDAHAGAIAEWKHGAGVGATNLFFLTLGTGVGGAAVADGHLLEGGSHALGEVGHITIVVGGRRCHCPNWGCFEAYVGGWGVAERARDAIRADPTAGAPLVERAGDVDALTAQMVFQAYRAGDPLSGRLVRETERFLADGAVSVVNAFNPSLLILGGWLVPEMPDFLPVVESAIRARCQPSAAGARVVLASLRGDAALVGASVVARERLLRRSARPTRRARS
ncbi:MAG: ROK family protein [Thermoplasmata archaeon]